MLSERKLTVPRSVIGAPFNQGFTLVEMLVVIGIISGLIAFLLPVLFRVRQQAMLVECTSNLHGLAQASLLYAADNRGVLPHDAFSGSNAFFAPCLQRYLEVTKPDETQMTVNGYTGPRVQVDMPYCEEWLRPIRKFKCPAGNQAYALHYVISSFDFARHASAGTFSETPWQDLNMVSKSSTSMMFAEANMTTLDPRALGQFNIYLPDDLPYFSEPDVRQGTATPHPRMISAGDRRHGGKTPIAFFDGHAEIRDLTDNRAWPTSMFFGGY
jgi:prepilin-type N-terminal cleavage/methylation domain-containing protein/prepilin-type processing-associated H-X9-DG protein